jgi:hypothetical protein
MRAVGVAGDVVDGAFVVAAVVDGAFVVAVGTMVEDVVDTIPTIRPKGNVEFLVRRKAPYESSNIMRLSSS